MKCCVESNNTSPTATQSQAQTTTLKPIRTTTHAPQTSKPTQKVEKPTKTDTKEGLIHTKFQQFFKIEINSIASIKLNFKLVFNLIISIALIDLIYLM